MPETTYTFSINNDFPGSPGIANISKLDPEVRASAITVALERIDVGVNDNEDQLDIVFKDELNDANLQILDGHTQSDVLNIQTDNTLDPGATPATGDRYILTNAASLHANFGTISGLENNDIVEYNGSAFVIDFDSNLSGNNTALLKNTDDSRYYSWNGTIWAASKAGGLIAVHDSTIDPSTLHVIVDNEIVTKKSSQAKDVYIFSPDVTDKTTWYHDGVQIANESVGVGDGATTQFQLQHGNGNVTGEKIVDLTHGKVTDETNIAPPNGTAGGYAAVVKINDVAQTEREVYMDSGGDWEMDYDEGLITFYNAPATGSIITVDYWYVPTNAMGCLFRLTAPEGTYTNVNYVEAQFTVDLNMKDSIVYTFTPEAFPTINLISPLVYKNMWNVLDFNVSSLPVVSRNPDIPSGTTIATSRNITADCHVFPWQYTSELKVEGDPIVIPGLGSQKIQLVAYLKHGIPYEGTRGTVTIYGTNRPNGT